MEQIQNIYSKLALQQKIVVTMHQKPDGDAMGSSLGLAGFLQKMGHTVHVISPTNWAPFLNWMPGCSTVYNYEKDIAVCDAILDEADILFCLDFNIFHRTKTLAPKLAAINCIKVLIDHHEQPDIASFNYGISIPAKSSTCEMVYDFIVGSGKADLVDESIASCLYAGLVTDTGSFRFKSTTAAVHQMVGSLMSTGIQHSKIHSNLFDNNSENRLRFIGNILSNRMEFFYEYNTALIHITKMDLLKFEIKTGDTEGLVNYPLSVQGIELAALVIDRDEERKWSFRSKSHFDCNTFARTYFNGGGHFNAAGGHSPDNLQETIKKFEQAMKENENLLSTYKN